MLRSTVIPPTSSSIGAILILLLLSSTAWAVPLCDTTSAGYSVVGVATATNDGEDINGSDSITVAEGGSIATDTPLGYALDARCNDNTLTNDGTILTQGLGAIGIKAVGDANTLSNRGTLTTIGEPDGADGAYGLYAEGTGNTLTNSGSVHTGSATAARWEIIEAPAEGDLVPGSQSQLVFIPAEVTGDYAHGIYALGNSNTLTNSGTVTTRGEYAIGIFSFSTGNNSLTNTGTVTTAGFSAAGIRADGDNNTLHNKGAVTTEGDSQLEFLSLLAATGISAQGNSNIMTNSGAVTTYGTASVGFYATGNENVLTNAGKVTTNGVDAHGIYTSGEGNTVNNKGTVLATAIDTYSVHMAGGGDATLNLLQGSVLSGEVFFGDAGTSTLTFGPGLNAVVSVAGEVPATITAPNDQYVVDGQTVYVFDGGFVGATEQAIGGVAGLMLDTLGQQMSYGSMVPAVTQGVAGTQREGWGQVFGTERTADGNVGDSTIAGFMVGADLDDVRGLFLGFARSTQEVDASNELESDNFFAGYYANYTLNGLNVDASLTAGMATNNTERSVANNTVVGGLEAATAEYKSYYLMPAATFSGDIPVASGSLTPSVRVSYAAIHDQAYTETGSAANLDVDSRTSHLFGTRVQLDRGLRGYAIGSGMLLANFRAGFDGQYTKGGDMTAALLGQSFELQASSDETSGRGFAGVDLRHVSDDTSHELFGSMEVGRSSTDVTDVSLKLGAVFQF